MTLSDFHHTIIVAKKKKTLPRIERQLEMLQKCFYTLRWGGKRNLYGNRLGE